MKYWENDISSKSLDSPNDMEKRPHTVLTRPKEAELFQSFTLLID